MAFDIPLLIWSINFSEAFVESLFSEHFQREWRRRETDQTRDGKAWYMFHFTTLLPPQWFVHGMGLLLFLSLYLLLSLCLTDGRCWTSHYITHPIACFTPTGDFFALALVNKTQYWIRHIARFGQDQSGRFLLLTQADLRRKTVFSLFLLHRWKS